MPAVNLSPLFNDATLNSSGDPGVGLLLFTYAAGSSTKTSTYTSSAGTTPQANPIVLNSRGEPASPIWLIDGISYKFVLAPSTDTDPPASPIRTIDNVVGVNDVAASAVSEWVASSATPTYISATSFSLVGDQTTDFHVGRRLKCTVTAGTVYATIGASAFTSLTTVTVQFDTGSLDSGLSAVALGINSAANRSDPLNDAAILAPYSPLTAFENLACAQASVATATITADKVVVTNATGRKAVLSTVSLTVNIASAGANGLDTGSEAASTWYYLWVIWTGVTTAGLISTSSTAPTLPSGYTHKGLVGAMYNSSGSDLVAFYQRGKDVRRAFVSILTDGSATARTQLTITAAVPPNAKKLIFAAYLTDDGTPATASLLASLAPSNAATFAVDAVQVRGETANNKGSGCTGELLFLASAQELWYSVGVADSDLDVDVIGWGF